MKSVYRPSWNSTAEEKLMLRSQAKDSVRVRGVGITPNPPRSLRAQPGNSKVQLTWERPLDTPVSAYRIYRDTENNLVLPVQDAGTLFAEIPSSSGATPTVTSFFISAVNAFGNESAKVQVISSAKIDAGAPSDPPPPPDPTPTGGGGGTGDLEPCFSGNVPVKTPEGDKRFDSLSEICMVLNKFGPRKFRLLVHYYKGKMRDMGNGELVTPGHHIKINGIYRPASEKFKDEVDFEGFVYNLHAIDCDDEEQMHYLLGNGENAHNNRKG